MFTDYSTNHGEFAFVKNKCNDAIKEAQSLNFNDFYGQNLTLEHSFYRKIFKKLVFP